MGKAYRLLLDLAIVILGLLLVLVLVFPQQKALRAEMKFRQSRSNLYTVRKAVERFMYEKSVSHWDESKKSWIYTSELPSSIEDFRQYVVPGIQNPFTQGTSQIHVFKAESSAVEVNLPLPVVWDTAGGGMWVMETPSEVYLMWEKAGLEDNVPRVLDDSTLIFIDPSTGRVRYDAWESGDKTPSLTLSITPEKKIFHLDTVPPEEEDKFSGWLYNYTVASYILSNHPELPIEDERTGSIYIKFIWPDPPELQVSRGQRRPTPRDSLVVEKPYISFSYYEYAENSFKPSFISKDDDSDTSWIAGRTQNPGDVALFILPPKYCLVSFGADGKPVFWEDPGKKRHVLIVWQTD
ncbi:hypothetical protein JW890_07955 [candidate division WOR-3 bacterium]|nr:hypothetical protein [candidate division WOR-3 bacterium]